MMALWCDLKRRGVAVRLEKLPYYFAWLRCSWRTTGYLRAVAAHVVGAVVTRTAPFPGRLAEACSSAGLRPSWFRYRIDGGRYQAVCVEERRLLSCARSENDIEKVVNILAAYRAYPDLVPEVIDADDGQGWYVERFIDIHQGEEEMVDSALERLRSAYKAEPARLGDIWQRMQDRTTEGLPTWISRFMEANAEWQIPVARVHGDLCAANVGIDAETGQLVLMDWEYSRTAALSYDLWHALFDRCRAGALTPERFAEAFEESAEHLLGLSAAEARVHHVLNAVDAYTFYIGQTTIPKQKIALAIALLEKEAIGHGAAD